MNLFDNLQSAMVATVTNTMGYDAEWLPKAGGILQTGKVLYKGPTEKEKLLSADYDPLKIVMEYNEGLFPGLFEASRSTGTSEEVTIVSVGTFYIKSVSKKWDGKSFEAYLKIKP